MDTEEAYEQALDDVLGDRTFEEPCYLGHFACSTVERGPCSDEAVAARYAVLLDEEE